MKTTKDQTFTLFSLQMRTIILFLTGFCSCEAQSGLSIPFLNKAPQVDGDLREWPSVPTTAFSIISQQPPLRNHADIWLGFDESNFYGAFSVQDTRLIQTRYGSGSPHLWFNDAVEIYVDAKNDSHDFMDGNDFQLVLNAFGDVVVFRGGDKYQLKVNYSQVPKDTVTDSFVLDCQTAQQGTVNENADTDAGYTLEFRIPWASLGIQPRDGYPFKIDLCLNDLDTLVRFVDIPNGVKIPQVSYQSITGSTNYGFPKNWQTATLYGEPSTWHRLKKMRSWPLITLGVLAVLLSTLVWLLIRNRRLRQIPCRADEDSHLAHFFEYAPPPPAVLPHQEVFSRAREIVIQQLNHDLPPTALAAQLFIGLRQLQRIFKEELQTTPNAFIISIKMEEAARRLRTEDVSIAELAYVLGFADPTYFARVFRKYFGCSPMTFADRCNQGW